MSFCLPDLHREIDGDFEAGGMRVSEPGMFGDPAEDCNCRCVALTRARWALDDDELQTLKDRAEYFGLDKTKDFDDFKRNYLKAAESENSVSYAEGERITKSTEFAVDPRITSSREYANKFDSMTDDKQEKREFLQSAKEMLKHRSGQNGEDLYLYNKATKTWYRSTTGSEAGTPEYTDAITKAIANAKKGELVSFHNHPASMPPSVDDINAALQNGYDVGYALCHDGKIFQYTASSNYIEDAIYTNRIAYFKQKGYNDFDAQVETMKHLSSMYGFTFKEVK